MCDEVYAQALVDLATKRYGGLDVAFNNAGTLGEMAPLPQLTRETWQHTLDTNLTSAFLGARHQVPAMVKRDRAGGALSRNRRFVVRDWDGLAGRWWGVDQPQLKARDGGGEMP